MTGSALDCFVCSPRAGPAPERAWQWTAARHLCGLHKQDCHLPDGERLLDAMQAAAPEDQPLEGNLLARVYNPVFVAGPGAASIKGWTDFAAGGFAVFEDRFGAQRLSEFWAMERLEAVDLLYALHLAVSAVPPLTEKALMGLVEDALSRGAFPARGGAGPLAALDTMQSLWLSERAIEQLRTQSRHWTPRSFAELEHWLSVALDGRAREPTGWLDPGLVARLPELARKRFVDLD